MAERIGRRPTAAHPDRQPGRRGGWWQCALCPEGQDGYPPGSREKVAADSHAHYMRAHYVAPVEPTKVLPTT